MESGNKYHKDDVTCQHCCCCLFCHGNKDVVVKETYNIHGYHNLRSSPTNTRKRFCFVFSFFFWSNSRKRWNYFFCFLCFVFFCFCLLLFSCFFAVFVSLFVLVCLCGLFVWFVRVGLLVLVCWCWFVHEYVGWVCTSVWHLPAHVCAKNTKMFSSFPPSIYFLFLILP